MNRQLSKHVFVVIALTSAVLTVAASVARPFWDDAWLTLMMGRVDDIRPFMGDRPVLGQAWQWMLETGAFWQLSYLLHFAGWFAMGIITATLWSVTFPGLRSHSSVVGTLAVAPIVCENQLLIATTMLQAQIPVVLALCAGLLSLRATHSSRRSLWEPLANLAPPGIVLISTQLSEYAVSASLSVSVVVLGLLTRTPSHRRSAATKAGMLVLAAFVGYAIYWMSADAQARQAVRPEAAFGGSIFYKMKVIPVELLNEVWLVTIGELAKAVSQVTIEPTYLGVGIFTFAAAGAVVLTWGAERIEERETEDEQSRAYSAVVLVAAVAAGLLPVVAMDKTGAFGGMATRFWLPVLPAAACIAYLAVLSVAGQRKRIFAAYVTSCLIVYSTATFVTRQVRTAQRIDGLGEGVRSELSPSGLNVAVLMSSEPDWTRMEWYELTARLTHNWPAQERLRFWAFPTLESALASTGEPAQDNTFPPLTINRVIRGLGPSGEIERFILIMVSDDVELATRHYDSGSERNDASSKNDSEHN